MRILRVFPRSTLATPDDTRAFVGDPPLECMRPDPATIDEVHISVAFTWDIERAYRLVKAWGEFYPIVKIGGPALGDPGGEFVPGRYLKAGYVITSRGCANSCDHCQVSDREGELRTLEIRRGWIVQDNNLLACPSDHIDAVFKMLAGQDRRISFLGGLEARRLTPSIATRICQLRLGQVVTAYDRLEQRNYVKAAIGFLRAAGGWSDATAITRLGCYVLVGFDGDSISAAIDRLEWILSMGCRPFPMFYQPAGDRRRVVPQAWKAALRPYLRPAILGAKARERKPTAEPGDRPGLLFNLNGQGVSATGRAVREDGY